VLFLVRCLPPRLPRPTGKLKASGPLHTLMSYSKMITTRHPSTSRPPRRNPVATLGRPGPRPMHARRARGDAPSGSLTPLPVSTPGFLGTARGVQVCGQGCLLKSSLMPSSFSSPIPACWSRRLWPVNRTPHHGSAPRSHAHPPRRTSRSMASREQLWPTTRAASPLPRLMRGDSRRRRLILTAAVESPATAVPPPIPRRVALPSAVHSPLGTGPPSTSPAPPTTAPAKRNWRSHSPCGGVLGRPRPDPWPPRAPQRRAPG